MNVKHEMYVSLKPPTGMDAAVVFAERNRLEELVTVPGVKFTGAGMMLDGSVVDIDIEAESAKAGVAAATKLAGGLKLGWTLTRVSMTPESE